MPRFSSTNDILRKAEQLEKEYDWVGASGSYEQALGSLSKRDTEAFAEAQKRIGYCFYRGAFQAETCKEFKDRMQLAVNHYLEGAKALEPVEGTKTRAEFNNLKALAKYTESRYASDFLSEKEQLNDSWKFAKEALRLEAKTKNQMNIGEICNNLMILLAQRLNLEWDAESRERLIEETLEYGERAIGVLKTQEKRQLALAYINAAYFCRNAAFAKGLGFDKREECREKALNYPRIAIDLSEKSDDKYVIAVSNLSLADARLDILGTAGLEEGQYYEKALQCGTKTKDKLVTANALFGLQYIGNNNAKTLEDPEKAREEYVKLGKYWENSVQQSKIIAYNSGIAMSCFQMVTTLRDQSRFESNIKNKQHFLEKAIEVGHKGLHHADISGSLAPTFHVTLSLGKAMLQLARIENDADRKKSLLNESLRLIKQSIDILKRATAVSLVEPREINLAFNIWTFAANQVELAKTEEDVGIKIGILLNSISSAETAYGYWLEWLRSQRASVEEPFWSLVGANEIEKAKTLNQLSELAEDRTYLRKSVEVLKRAVDAYEKSGLPTLKAESYWQIAKTYDELGEHLESAKNFGLACESYKLATKKMPRLEAFYDDYTLYMQAWSELEKARYYQTRQEYGQSAKHYRRAAGLHKASKSWKHLVSNYLAWAQLELGEDLSLNEWSRKAKLAFRNATKLFRQAERSLRAELNSIADADEKELADRLIKASSSRLEYCLGRIAVEEARILDSEGDHAASSETYGLAVEKFQGMKNSLEHASDKIELSPIICLCKAWQMMTKAEAEARPELYLEASEFFIAAKEAIFNEKAKLLSLASSQFCKALEAGARFEETRDAKTYFRAKELIETAENYYLKAAFNNASEYAKATGHLFDAYFYVENAKKENDPEKEARYYTMAEKVLQTSAQSYAKAKHPEKVEQVNRLLENIREERKLALSLSEVLHAPTLTSSTASFVSLTPNEELAVGLERFEHADIHARVVQHEKEIRVGEDLNIEIQITNVGKEVVLLRRIEEILPTGFKLVAKPDYCQFENQHLDMRGKQLNPLKTEIVQLTLESFDTGSFNIKPRVICVDETGNHLLRVLEPATIIVSEAVLPGRVATEFKELDVLLLGGIPENYTVVLTSPSCDERDQIVKSFLEGGTRQGQITFCITDEPGKVADLIKRFPAGLNFFVCNARADVITEDLPNVFKFKGVENLTDIDIALVKFFRTLSASPHAPRRACIEIVSDVLLHHHAVITRKWLVGLLADLKSRGFTTLAVINPLMHPSEEVHAIVGLFEGEISIHEKENREVLERYVAIRKMRNQRYLSRALLLKKKS